MEAVKLLSIISEALGVSTEKILKHGKVKKQLYARYIAVAILREEGYSDQELRDLFSNFSRNMISNHCPEVFENLINYNREFKDMYLTAVRAVEDQDYEDENDTPAA